MKTNKWTVLVCILTLVVVSIGLFGCGEKQESQSPASEQSAKTPKIAVLMPSLTGQVYVSLVYGILDEAEKMGLEQPIVLSAGGYDKQDVQVKQVEDMIAAGVDVIAVMPLSEDGLTPVLDRAVDAGIIVFEFGNHSNSEKVHARVRSDDFQLGVHMGEACVKALNGKGNVVMFNGPAGTSWSQTETEGFKSVMSNYPDIKILAEKWIVYDTAVAMNTMADLLQAFPDIDYIYTAYDGYAEGAARALKQAGLDGKIKMGTASLTVSTLELLKEGTLDYVVGTAVVTESRMAIQTILKIWNGEEYPTLQHKPIVDFYHENANDPNLDTTQEFAPEGWIVPN